MGRVYKYPLKSHPRPIIVPDYSAKLAEIIGIHLGDGELHNPWQVVISCNAQKDRLYADHILMLYRELFGLEGKIYKRKDENTLKIIFYSSKMVDYFLDHGLYRGRKQELATPIPVWVLSNPAWKRACVRGLFDTDGCLYIHRHTVSGKRYYNLGFCFTNYNRAIIEFVYDCLVKDGLKPSLHKNRRYVYIYNKAGVEKYLELFGSSNPRIINEYNNWRVRLEA